MLGEKSMIWLGVIIMVVGFFVVIVGAKTQKQPVAVGGTILLLAGLVLYAVYTFYQPPNTDYQVYEQAQLNAVGKALQGKYSKLILVTSKINNPENNEYKFKAVELLKNAFGGTVEEKIIEENTPGMESLSIEDVNKILKGTTPQDVVVFHINISVENRNKKVDFLSKSYKGARVFFTSNGSIMVSNRAKKDFDRAFKDGVIAGAVLGGGKNEEGFSPDEDELDEAFANNYILMTKDNFDLSKFTI